VKIELSSPPVAAGGTPQPIEKLYVVVFWERAHFTIYLNTVCPTCSALNCTVIQEDGTSNQIRFVDITSTALQEPNAWTAVWEDEKSKVRFFEGTGHSGEDLPPVVAELVSTRGIAYLLGQTPVAMGSAFPSAGKPNVMSANGSGLPAESYFAIWSKWTVPIHNAKPNISTPLRFLLESTAAVTDISVYFVPPPGFVIRTSASLCVDDGEPDLNCLAPCLPDSRRYLSIWQSEHHILRRNVYKLRGRLTNKIEESRINGAHGRAALDFSATPETPGSEIVSAVYIPIFASFLASYGVDGARLHSAEFLFWPAATPLYLTAEGQWLLLIALLFLNLVLHRVTRPYRPELDSLHGQWWKSWSGLSSQLLWTVLPKIWFWLTIVVIGCVLAVAGSLPTVQQAIRSSGLLTASLQWFDLLAIGSGMIVLALKLKDFGVSRIWEVIRTLPNDNNHDR
jgi:hypothetical protein